MTTTPHASAVPGPLSPGDVVDLGDGVPWTVTRLELRGGLHLPGGEDWETWALLTHDSARQWVQVQEPEIPPFHEGDEGGVLDLVEQRLALGRHQYGPLRVDDDHRDFQQEALEELLDGCAYLACELLRLRQGKA